MRKEQLVQLVSQFIETASKGKREKIMKQIFKKYSGFDRKTKEITWKYANTPNQRRIYLQELTVDALKSGYDFVMDKYASIKNANQATVATIQALKSIGGKELVDAYSATSYIKSERSRRRHNSALRKLR